MWAYFLKASVSGCIIKIRRIIVRIIVILVEIYTLNRCRRIILRRHRRSVILLRLLGLTAVWIVIIAVEGTAAVCSEGFHICVLSSVIACGKRSPYHSRNHICISHGSSCQSTAVKQVKKYAYKYYYHIYCNNIKEACFCEKWERTLTPTLSQSKEAATPLKKFCAKTNLTASRVGNLVTLHSLQDGTMADLLLDIGRWNSSKACKN